MAVTAIAAVSAAHGQQPIAAVLRGHAVLPALELRMPPADAPLRFATSGAALRDEAARTVASGPTPVQTAAAPADMRPSGVTAPFAGQPLQGISAIQIAGDGALWALSDNGYGTRRNSADAMLMLHQLRPHWSDGTVSVLKTMFLSDPRHRLPFPIVTAGSASRYLSGADLDPESLQIVGDTMWIGDEFGPYLVALDLDGRVQTLYEATLSGAVLRSPEHHTAVLAPRTPADGVRSSRGFEGLARSPDGRFLYPVLEGALETEPATAAAAPADAVFSWILEFDTELRVWTGRAWKYRLEDPLHSVGDFILLDADRGLIIERDPYEGAPEDACNGLSRPDCYARPARFKRIYRVNLAAGDADGYVAKESYVDLLSIADPDRLALRGTREGRFTFPFVTIEALAVVDDRHLIVVNDNNLPFSAGRRPAVHDDTEFILLDVGSLLAPNRRPPAPVDASN